MSFLDSIRRILPATALAAVFALTPALTLAQDATPAAGGELTPYDEASVEGLSGEIVSDGSSTVGPLTTFAAEEFSAIAPDVDISVDISGTGAGFDRFCAGETDLQNASRAIEEDEIELCAENGVEFYEFRAASDGITLAVSQENDFLTCISAEDLAKLMVAGSEIETWADLNSEFPDETISFYTAADTSGTYDFFVEALGIDEEGQRGVADGDPNVTSGEDDNALVEGIAGSPYALGYFGYSYYAENTDRLRAVQVTATGDEADCVEPSPETITDDSYTPLSRPLFVYAKAESLQENPAMQEFLRFFIANAEEIAVGVDFVPASTERYVEAQAKLEGAISGEVAPDNAA